MAKEKRMNIEQNRKELTFYYELIGVSTILLSLVALARLGIVGYYIMMTFRIVFGDWYFGFLLALLLFGIYCLFKHQPLNIKNMRSIGVILLMIGILTISHFPMHNYISQFGDNYLGMTFSLYLDYFKNYQEGMIVGGGIIGMLFFYLFYTLFSSAGTIVIVLFISLVGISFSFNKTIGESLSFFKKILLKFFSIFKGFGKTLKYGIEVNTTNKDKIIIDKKPHFSLDMLSNVVRNNYIITEEKHAVSLKKTLSSVLNNMNIFYQGISYLVSEHVTTLTIDTVASINLDKLYMRLKSILTETFLITKDVDSPRIKIEIDNIDCNSVYLKTMFTYQNNYLNNLKLPIGIDTNNCLVDINFLDCNNVLILEQDLGLIYELIMGYIIMLSIKLTKINYECLLLDLNKNSVYDNNSNYYQTINEDEIEKLKKDVDKRLELMNNIHSNDLIDYNNKAKDNLPLKFIYICSLEKLLSNYKKFDDLLYLLQVGRTCGYYFIIHYDYHEILTSKVDSLFDIKIIGKNSKVSGEKYLGINPYNYLHQDEAFYMYKDELIRFSLAKATTDEVNKILIKTLAK